MHSGLMEVVERKPRMSDQARIRAVDIRVSEVRLQGDRAIEIGNRSRRFISVRHEDDTTAVVGLRVVRPQFDRACKVSDGQLSVPTQVVGEPSVVEGLGEVRMQSECAAVGLNRSRVVPGFR